MFCAVTHFDVRLGWCCVKITHVASKIHSNICRECVSNHLLIFRKAPRLHLHLKEAQTRFCCQSEAGSLNPSKAEWKKRQESFFPVWKIVPVCLWAGRTVKMLFFVLNKQHSRTPCMLSGLRRDNSHFPWIIKREWISQVRIEILPLTLAHFPF